MNPEEIKLLQVLESYEELLNSETQAIAVADLDKLEVILESKDEVLAQVLDAQAQVPESSKKNDILDVLIDRVMELQSRNARALGSLIRSQVKEKEATGEGSSRLKKVREAYFSHMGASDGGVRKK